MWTVVKLSFLLSDWYCAELYGLWIILGNSITLLSPAARHSEFWFDSHDFVYTLDKQMLPWCSMECRNDISWNSQVIHFCQSFWRQHTTLVWSLQLLTMCLSCPCSASVYIFTRSLNWLAWVTIKYDEMISFNLHQEFTPRLCIITQLKTQGQEIGNKPIYCKRYFGFKWSLAAYQPDFIQNTILFIRVIRHSMDDWTI